MKRQNANQLAFLDFAKGYAILTIVLYHAWQKADLTPAEALAIGFGGTGVHLFFLLSGYGLSLARPAASPLEFYRRRAVKVWLPYVLAVTISLVAALTLGLYSGRWDSWVAGVSLYQMFSEKHIQGFGGHFWFISTIIQFYLAWPLLTWLRGKLGSARAFFGLSLLISVAWWLLVYYLGRGEWRTWNSFFLQFLWEFALGMILAERFKQDRSQPSRQRLIRGDFWNYPTWFCLPVALLFSALMVLITVKAGVTGRIFNDIPALLGYTAFCILLFQASAKLAPALQRFLAWVGRFSFSLYLIHIVVLELFLRGLAAADWPLNGMTITLYLLLSLLAGRALEALNQAWIGLFDARTLSRSHDEPSATAGA